MQGLTAEEERKEGRKNNIQYRLKRKTCLSTKAGEQISNTTIDAKEGRKE